MNKRQLAGLLASVGATLASMVAISLLGSLSNAAPGPDAHTNQVAENGYHAGEPMTATVYMPIVNRAKPINFWTAEYYDNSTLSGKAVLTAEEKAVDYDWDLGAPPGLPSNLFSARWSGDWAFEEGEYTFFIYVDDGVRLWVDNSLVIDHWLAGMGVHQAEVVFSDPGIHHLKLEYFEQAGQAAIRLHWRRSDLYPAWDGEYYRNPWLNDSPVYKDSSSAIQFDWGYGAPGLLPADAFSVDWSSRPTFPGGTHHIFVYADEGYQLLVDGDVVQEGGWIDGQTGGAEDDSYRLDTAALETVEVGYHVHDRGGPAEARLWIAYADQPVWTAEYYSNKNLTGSPVKAKSEAAIFHDWGLEAPTGGVPNDGFSVRWTGQGYFHAGAYRFGIYADDGVKLWVDGALVLDAWRNGWAEHRPPIMYLSTGYHDLVLEYFENTGEAEIRLWWE